MNFCKNFIALSRFTISPLVWWLKDMPSKPKVWDRIPLRIQKKLQYTIGVLLRVFVHFSNIFKENQSKHVCLKMSSKHISIQQKRRAWNLPPRNCGHFQTKWFMCVERKYFAVQYSSPWRLLFRWYARYQGSAQSLNNAINMARTWNNFSLIGSRFNNYNNWLTMATKRIADKCSLFL